MPFKRGTFHTKMKIGIHLEHRNGHLFIVRGFSDQKKMFENADMYGMNWRNAIFMHFHAIVPDVRSSREHSNHKL